MFRSLALFSAFTVTLTASWSYDTTLAYKDGRVEGVIRLDARTRQVESPADVANKVKFPFGLSITSTGLPDFNASCNTLSYGAFLAEVPATGTIQPDHSSGFGAPGDTVWSNALEFPDRLFPLDTVRDRFPEITKRNAILGTGWIHSLDETKECRTAQQRPGAGHRRIFYYRFKNGPFLKAQVDRFETEPVTCIIGEQTPCSQSKYVFLRYAITDDPQGRFPTPHAGMRDGRADGRVGMRLPAAYPLPIWEYVLGRMP
jgi:hypothetical protein